MSEPNGLNYMKARYYDAGVDRFISEDPKGFDGGDVNLMAYVQNNPIMGIDPDGLSTIGNYFWGKLIQFGTGKAINSSFQSMNDSGRRIIESAIKGAVSGTVIGSVTGAVGGMGIGAIPGAILGGVTGFTGGISTQTIIESAGFGSKIEILQNKIINSSMNIIGISNSTNTTACGR